MTNRWSLGPVFAFEWLANSRRWQVYAVRSLFVTVLLLAMSLIWWSEIEGQFSTTIQAQSAIGESFYQAIVLVQMVLVLLAAPAATAGAVCLDKARGTLEHLLVTDLSDAEIFLGKLGARLIPVIAAVACSLPVIAIATLLGGIDPVTLSGAFLVTLGVAIVSCTLAMTLSVWGKKAHEVLMATYLILLLWLLALPLALFLAWNIGGPRMLGSALALKVSNPIYVVLAPYTDPGAVSLGTHVAFLGACLVISAALTVAGVLKVRAVAVRQAGRGVVARPMGRRLLRFPFPAIPGWPRPTLDQNPVLWREWHRRRASGWTALVWLVYGLIATAASAIALGNWINYRSSDAPALVNMFQGTVGLLLLTIPAATSLAEERTRGSLDVLLATPLSTRSILWGKWYGSFRSVPRLAIVPMLVAAALTGSSGHVFTWFFLMTLFLAYGAGITSLGLACATWQARLGRAIALTAAVYVIFTCGWAMAILLIFRNAHLLGPGLAMGSPLFGIAFGSLGVGDGRQIPSDFRGVIAFWLAFWTFVHVAVAVTLYLATLWSFDRCLGRCAAAPDPRPYAEYRDKLRKIN